MINVYPILQSKPSSRGGKDVADLSTQDDGGDSSSATVEDKARTPGK